MKEKRFQFSLRCLFGIVAILAFVSAGIVRWFAYIDFLEQSGHLSYEVIWITIFLVCVLIGFAMAAVFVPVLWFLTPNKNVRRRKRLRNHC